MTTLISREILGKKLVKMVGVCQKLNFFLLNFREQRIYSGGNYENLVEMTQWQPNSVLYFGDHPYADLADLSMVHGWRTCAIIEDLEEEIDKLNGPQMKMKTNWTNVLQGLLDNYQDSLHDEECKKVWYEWKDELDHNR